jgi:hypothetical protein
MQQVVLIPCRRFGRAYQSHLQGPRSFFLDSCPSTMGPIRCPEMSFTTTRCTITTTRCTITQTTHFSSTSRQRPKVTRGITFWYKPWSYLKQQNFLVLLKYAVYKLRRRKNLRLV